MNETAYDIAKMLGYGYLSIEEVDCLHRLAALVPADPGATMINIGAGAGTSGLALREGNQLAHIVTIDIRWESPLGSLLSEIHAFERAGKEPPEQIQSGSIRVGQEWKRGKVDLVFVDGDHTEKGIRGDITAWLPNIKQGGILAFHDYDGISLQQWPAVRQVVDELVTPRFPVVDKAGRIVAFRIEAKRVRKPQAVSVRKPQAVSARKQKK